MSTSLRRSPLTAALLLTILSIGSAQSDLFLYDPDVSSFPIISADFLLLDSTNSTYGDLDISDISITEQGVVQEVLSLSCPPPQPARLLSSVLTIDISGSMSNSVDGVSNIAIAKGAARAWVTLLPGASECAVTSFDNDSYIDQDFTGNRQRLHDAIDALSASGGTNYEAGLLDGYTGALAVAARGSHHRVVIFLTDGTSTIDEDSVVAVAQRNGIVLYTITLGIEAPVSLKNIAARTGGLCFEQIISEREAIRIYRRILLIEQGGKPCTVRWRSKPGCATSRTVRMVVLRRGVVDSISANYPPASVPTLEMVPDGIRFEDLPPGKSRDTLVTITARNAPVTLTMIVPGDAHLAVDSGAPSPGLVLQPGDSIRLRIRFTATDSGYVFSWFSIESDACVGSRVVVSGGYPGHAPTARTLRLVVPNGGERYATGEDARIEWEGIAPDDTVRLDYSIDGGATWKTIVRRGAGLHYDWRIPPTPSSRCLARVDQIGGEGRAGEIVQTLRGHQKDVVEASFWSSDGKIVTGGSDGTVRLWDAGTGALLLMIPVSQFGTVRARLSPDGRRILTSGYATTADVWDAATGMLLQKLSGHTALVTDARFSSDGTRIITAGKDGTIIVRDQFGSQLAILTGLNIVVISPDGTSVATVAPGNVVHVRSIAGDLVQAQLIGHTAAITDIAYSRDGNRIVTASVDRTARVWDVTTGAQLLTLSGHADVVASARFSPDGGRIVTGSFDNSVRVWDAATGTVVRLLQGHRSVVHTADFSSDGRLVVSGSGDNTAIIWELTPAVIQSDTSDNLWEIVTPRLTAGDIDMGRVITGDGRDAIVARWLCNTGTVPVTIRELSITGTDAADFDRVAGPSLHRLLPGECASVEFRFAPSAAGLRRATIRIVTASDTILAIIRGEGIERELVVESSLVDFGRVAVGGRRDTVVDVVLRNVGSRTLSVPIVRQQGPDLLQFTVSSGADPFSLLPGERHSMTLSFAPERMGRTSGTIVFEHDAAGTPMIVRLFGEGYCDGERRIVIGPTTTIEADAGEVVTIPLRVLDADFVAGGPRSFRGTLRFNSTLLLPVGTAPAGDTGLVFARYSDTALGYLDGTDRLLPVSVDSVAPNGELLQLIFIAALGDADTTLLRIEESDWGTECPVATTIRNGLFRLRGICREDGSPRLFQADGTVGLKIVSANPTHDIIDVSYELIEPGWTRLRLIDVRGETVTTLMEAESGPGLYRLRRGVRELSSGTYFLMLETPTITVMQPVRVER